MITIKILGINQLIQKMSGIPVNLKSELSKAVKKSAFLVEEKSKETVSTGPLRAYQTGALWRSITPAISPFKAIIAPHVEYAEFIHEGTRYMKPRPFMKVGVEKAEKDIQKAFDDAINKVIKI